MTIQNALLRLQPLRILSFIALGGPLLALCLCNDARAQTNVTTAGGTIGRVPKWTATSALSDSIITESSGNIGIGTATPNSLLHLTSGANSTSHFRISSFVGTTGGTDNADTGRGLFSFTRGRNTEASPQALANGDTIGKIGFFGYDSSPTPALNIGAVIVGAVDSAVPTGSIPTALIFQTNGLNERMRITSSGRLGLGTGSPAVKFQIDLPSAVPGGAYSIADGLALTTANSISGIQLVHGSSTAFMALNTDSLGSGTLGIGTKGNYPLYFYTNSGLTAGIPSTTGVRMAIDTSGRVGIGTLSPSTTLHVAGTASVTGGNLGIGTTSPTSTLHVLGTAFVSGAVTTGALTTTSNVTVNGNVSATGTIYANYQDVAEWVPTTASIAAGTVVVLDPEHSNHVLASSRAYDTSVAGVVSEKPGVVLGQGGEGKVLVATTGRVRIKVDATRAPIHVGDLLVTSEEPGVAMRSIPIDVGGTLIHRPGTLIGKALESLEKGVGEILVLLSLQ